MSRQRRHFSAEFKAKAALEAIREQKTLNEIASEYGVHPNLVRDWKKHALRELPAIFTSAQGADAQAHEAEKERLFQQIGQLQYELAWLKKSWRGALTRNVRLLREQSHASAFGANAPCSASVEGVGITSRWGKAPRTST